jgi:hypothetical protein
MSHKKLPVSRHKNNIYLGLGLTHKKYVRKFKRIDTHEFNEKLMIIIFSVFLSNCFSFLNIKKLIHHPSSSPARARRQQQMCDGQELCTILYLQNWVPSGHTPNSDSPLYKHY